MNTRVTRELTSFTIHTSYNCEREERDQLTGKGNKQRGSAGPKKQRKKRGTQKKGRGEKKRSGVETNPYPGVLTLEQGEGIRVRTKPYHCYAQTLSIRQTVV